MSNEDECIENLMKKMGRSQRNVPLPSAPSRGPASREPEGQNEKFRAGYNDLLQRHTELVDYIAKMSREQVSDSYLECIKNDNVLLYQVNQELRLTVKDLCIKINDLKNEGRKLDRTPMAPFDADEQRNQGSQGVQGSLGRSKRSSKEQERLLELKEREIEQLGLRLGELERSKADLERQVRELSQAPRFPSDPRDDDKVRAFKQATRELSEAQAINRNLESINKQKSTELSSLSEKAVNLQSQLAERERRWEREALLAKNESEKVAVENQNLRRALYDATLQTKETEKTGLEAQILSDQLSTARKEIEDERRKATVFSRENETLKTQNNALQTENQLSKYQLEELRAKLAALEAKFREFDFSGASKMTPTWLPTQNSHEIDELRSRTQQMTKELETASQITTVLNQKVNELQTLLENARRENRDKSVTVTRSYVPRPSISPRPENSQYKRTVYGEETPTPHKQERYSTRYGEMTVQSIHTNQDYLLKELELAKAENERLKNQIHEITQINHKNVDEIVHLTARINEMHMTAFNVGIHR
jgi:hypothetical protein